MTISKREFDAHARRTKAIDAATARAFNAVMAATAAAGTLTSLSELSKYLPPVADRLGKVAAVEAAEFYDTCRAASKAKGAYSAVTQDGKLRKLERDIAYATGTEFAYSDTAAFLRSCLAETVRSYGRDTLEFNASADRACDGYISMPTGSDPCAFCIMKSLGTYRNYDGHPLTEAMAGDAWHTNCTCELTPLFGEIPDWASEQMDAYGEMYDAANTARSGEMPEDLKAHIEAAKERHAKLVANGKTDKKWSSANETLVVMRYQNKGMH